MDYIEQHLKIGNTSIYISSERCVKTQEEIDRILARVAVIVQQSQKTAEKEDV